MFKVKVKFDTPDIKRMLSFVRKEFAKEAPRVITRAITSDITSGVSPVLGKGRYPKYSESYKAQIKGEAAFLTNSKGNVFAITTKGKRGFTKEKNKIFIEVLNEHLKINGKRLAPVNLKVTGKMIKSLFARVRGSFSSKFSMFVAFADDVAEFHNNRGAGGKTVRRVLPTNIGEKFNSKISGIMTNLLNKSVSAVVNRFK